MLQFSSPISHFKFIKSGCFVIPLRTIPESLQSRFWASAPLTRRPEFAVTTPTGLSLPAAIARPKSEQGSRALRTEYAAEIFFTYALGEAALLSQAAWAPAAPRPAPRARMSNRSVFPPGRRWIWSAPLPPHWVLPTVPRRSRSLPAP